MIKSTKLLAVLPETEPFSPVRGGALAIWGANIYSHLSDFLITVACSPDLDEYPGFHIQHTAAQDIYSAFFNKLPPRLQYRLPTYIKSTLADGYIRRIVAHIKQAKYDVIHIHNRPQYTHYLRKGCPDAAIILHLQNDHLLNYSPKDRETIITICDRVLFCSKFILDNALRGLPNHYHDRCSVIYNGVDCTRFNPEAPRPSNMVLPATPYVLFVGRLIPDKGAHVLLKEIATVFEKIPNLHLLVVGGAYVGGSSETSYIGRLKALAAPFQNRVSFTGPVSHKDLPGVFAHAEAFVCPSLWEEPFGMVNVEAMACGTPVIASNRGGIPEAVGDAGVLFDPEEPGQLAEKLLRILESPDSANHLTRKARERSVNFFDWKALSIQFRDMIYQSGLAK